MSLLDFFKSISAALNDDNPARPYERYKLEDMLEAFKHGICLIEELMPEKFTIFHIVKLRAGTLQNVSKCCKKIKGIIAQTDEKGNVIQDILSNSSDRYWRKSVCLPMHDGHYRLQSYTLDKDVDGYYYVYPPVPCGADVYLNIKCVSNFGTLEVEDLATTEVNVDCSINGGLWHYVLARMLSGNRFSNSSLEDANTHYTLFRTWLDLLKQEKMIEDKKENTNGM